MMLLFSPSISVLEGVDVQLAWLLLAHEDDHFPWREPRSANNRFCLGIAMELDVSVT